MNFLKTIVCTALTSVVAFLARGALDGNPYVHSTDWQGYDQSGFVIQSDGYYWCCQYMPDGNGVRITGFCSYYEYPTSYYDEWDPVYLYVMSRAEVSPVRCMSQPMSMGNRSWS